MEFIATIDVFGPYGWLIIPFGLFLGLLGYRLYKISLFVIGLFVGLSLGQWLGGLLENPNLGWILGAVIGIALGIATHFLIRFSLFLAGMAAGAVIASMVLPYTSLALDSMGTLIVYAASALVGGLATLVLYKILILFVTSLVGTYMIWLGTAHVFPAGSERWTWILYIVLLAVFVIVQAGARKGHDDPVERDRERRRR
jgi:hypothetical protein